MKEKAILLDQEAGKRCVTRISHEILEKNKGVKGICIVGIRTRGENLAGRIADCSSVIEKEQVDLGVLDITLYRDDLTSISQQPVVHKTEIGFDITGRNVVLVDDVLYTGRTVRCALDALADLGRPRTIQLAVLVDRGHKELPIRADFVGQNVPTSREETVVLRLTESDGRDEVVLKERGNE